LPIPEAQHPTVVTQQFNWKGELTAYVTDHNETVPRGNSRFDEISESIAERRYVVRHPHFTSARQVIGYRGKLTGHDTNMGFVPMDGANHLRVLLAAALARGELTEDPWVDDRSDLLTHVVSCMPFDRRIPHLRQPTSLKWRYRSTPMDAWVDVDVMLSNLPTVHHDLQSEYLKERGIASTFPLSLSPISRGVIEVSFPVDRLVSLYRAESRTGLGWKEQFVTDEFERACVRDGRPQSSPRTQSMIQLSPHFLHRPSADIANEVLLAINLEFGGPVAGFASEADASSRLTYLGRISDGTYKLLHLSSGGPTHNEFNLAEWKHRALQHDETETAQKLDFPRLQHRIRSLVDAGFALEAVSLGNAFFEHLALIILRDLVRDDAPAATNVSRLDFGHGRRLDVLERLSNSLAREPLGGELGSFVRNAREVYDHRNLYMHAMASRDHELTRSVDLTRLALRLLSPIVDHYQAFRLLGSWIVGPSDLSPDIKARVIADCLES
jgi:hypothetical protein